MEMAYLVEYRYSCCHIPLSDQGSSLLTLIARASDLSYHPPNYTVMYSTVQKRLSLVLAAMLALDLSPVVQQPYRSEKQSSGLSN
ncbi:hypothetical protein ACSS6W_004288 [Trichoderma asperelloides]